MTKENFFFMIQVKKEWEFIFNDIVYNLTYGTDEKGDYIAFGERYLPERFYSLSDFMNTAKIENHYFKEILELL